jgi:hypothetical protein
LALKNDFNMRQYLIENGMSLTKNDDEDSGRESNASGMAQLEIHQIHNVIRGRYRPAITAVDNIRRNSTTSNISGLSTLMINGRENNNSTPTTENRSFAQPQPARPIVRPIQIKTEPVDPDDSIQPATLSSSTSPSSSSNSVLTVSSSTQLPPMIAINGHVSLSKTGETPIKNVQLISESSKAMLLVPSVKELPPPKKKGRPKKVTKVEKPERPIRARDKKKIVDALRRTLRQRPAVNLQKNEINAKKLTRAPHIKVVDKKSVKNKNEKERKKLGRPRKNPEPQRGKKKNAKRP